MHIFLTEVGADIVSLHGQAVEDNKDMKQVSYDYCFMRDQPGRESAKIRVERPCNAHGVSSCGAIEGSRSCLADSTMCWRFGTIGTPWTGYIEV